MSVCPPCRQGNHQHDRHTGRVPGTRTGDDAGCPNQGTPGDINSHCDCDVTLPPTRTQPHCPTCTC